SALQLRIEAISTALANGDSDALQANHASVIEVIKALDEGQLRVASQHDDQWQTHAWIKEAILMFFRISEMAMTEVGPFIYYDKIPLKRNYERLKVRVVPPATARFGSFMEPGVV